jgi:integrase
MGKLSDVQLKAWVRDGSRIAGRSDGDGLTFTLSAQGAATWTLRYRIAGRARELTLGRYPDLSLGEARKLAAAKRVDVQQVIDVAAIKQQKKTEAKQAANVQQLAELWLDNTVRRRHQHPEVTERVFKRDILPALGKCDTKRLTTPEITRLLAKINASGRPSIANDALRHMKAMFAYGEALGMVDRNPAERIKLEHAGGQEKSRTRALSTTEIAKLLKAMREAGTKFGRDNELAVKLLLALACRKMELFAANWDEFDFSNNLWRIPATRVKTGESRELALSPEVIEWLQELKIRACGSNYVFPARRESKRKRFPHVSPDTTWRALHELNHGLEAFTVHDLRRTSRSLMADIGVPFDVAEKILGHKLPGVAHVYDRGGSREQQRAALNRVAQMLTDLGMGRQQANVVSLTRGSHAA